MKGKIIAIGLLALLVLIAGCGKTPTGNAVAVTFKELCQQNSNMFMTMPPTIDGVPTGEPACPGWMIAGSHYCSQEEYLKALGSR